jgi:hypothetical protein
MVAACARRNRRHCVSERRSRYPFLLEDPADRRRADAVAELEWFALNALVVPGRVLSGQPPDQRGDGLVEGWAPERPG